MNNLKCMGSSTAEKISKNFESYMKEQEMSPDPERSRRNLIEAGILNEDGTVAEPYKDVLVAKNLDA